MSKLLILLVFITGCNSSNKSLYEEVEKECPRRCEVRESKWTGYIKVFSDIVLCACDKD